MDSFDEPYSETQRVIYEWWAHNEPDRDLGPLEFAAMMGVGSIDCRSSRCPRCDEAVTTTRGLTGLHAAEREHMRREHRDGE